jgi:hypothetical protein
MICLAALIGSMRANVVINEIMYHPPDDQDQLQFVELFNGGSEDVDLSGWSFTKGAKFQFPAGVKIAGGGFIVICRNRAAFSEHYGAAVPVAGVFQGRLSHGGERIELSDSARKLVDYVIYDDSHPWPQSADGHSASLERIAPTEPGNNAANWAASNLPEMKACGGSPGLRNDSFSPALPPVLAAPTTTPPSPRPNEEVVVEANVSSSKPLATVDLFYRVLEARDVPDEIRVPMQRIAGDAGQGRYRATIPAQPEGRLIRYRIEAAGTGGIIRRSPAANDLREAWSYSTFVKSNTARIPRGILWRYTPKPLVQARGTARSPKPEPSRGRDCFFYIPPGGEAVQTFDFVHAPSRKGGYKVHFLKGQTLRGMTTVNIIFEQSPRYVLAEPLAYELYRQAGVPAELTEHICLSIDGTERGYYLLVEQPNKSFLRRNGRDDSGNLYKLIWYGQDLVAKHEKKTNAPSGHDDLLALIGGLTKSTGAEQWEFIQKHFNVDEFASYFAVNMCIQNWDGFHNNYFLYHDTGGSGRWEIYPWDEDKTWGDYDGATSKYDWYDMPLTFGMLGSRRPASFSGPMHRVGPFEGWWREAGYLSGPLLANAQFRQVFLKRLRALATEVFTEAKMMPLIDDMESRLAEEVAKKAQITRSDPNRAASLFRAHIQSFREQDINRRKFILAELDKVSR